VRDVKVRPKDLERVRGAIRKMQGGLCELCHRSVMPGAKLRATMDHDHATGYIRGVLCIHCNGMLGKVENASRRAVGKEGNNVQWLDTLVNYLVTHEKPQWSVPGVRWGLIYPTHKTSEDKRLARLERAKKKRRTAAAVKKLR